MPTERIDIVVTERGTREVKRNLDDIGASANKSGSALSLLRKTLLLLGGAAAAKRLIDFADTFTNIQNRVRVVTADISQLNVVTEELFAIAQRTRQSFEATTEIFARTSLAVKDLGISQRETLNFTESLNQAIILSGASSQEAQAGMIQLSQALAAGALRGDELRSVLEQLPVVADVIAKQMHVTRGELRGLGEQGKITSDIILAAFKNARGELADKFAKTLPTIGQGFTVLRNALVKTIGEFGKANGAAQGFARTLIFLAEHMETVARVFAAASIVIGVVFAQHAISKAIAGVRALTIAIAANPIGAIAIALTAIIATLVAFGDKIFLTSDSFVTLQDLAVAAFQGIREAIAGVGDFFRENFGFITTFTSQVVGNVDLDFKTILQFAAAMADALIGIFNGAGRAIAAAFSSLPRALQNTFNLAWNQVLTDAQNAINKIIQQLNKLPGFDIELVNFGQIEDKAKGGARELGDTIKKAFLEGFSVTTVGDALENTFKRAEQIAKNRLNQDAADKTAAAGAQAGLGRTGANTTPRINNQQLQEDLKLLRQENQLLQVQGLERLKLHEIYKIEKDIKSELTVAEKEQVAALVEEHAQLEARSNLIQQIQGPQEQLRIQQQALNQLLKDGTVTIQQYNVAMTNLQIQTLEAGTTAAEGFHRGFLKIKADILDVSSAAERTLTNAWHSAEDALVEFVTTGKVNFSKLVDSILADLTRLLARQALAALLNAISGASSGGGGGAGVIGSIIGALGGAKAEGGPVSPGKAFLVGEKGPELFVPRAAGNVMPNKSLTNVAAAPPPQVNVQVVNVDSQDKVPQAMSSQKGDKVILNSLTRNRAAVKHALGIA